MNVSDGPVGQAQAVSLEQDACRALDQFLTTFCDEEARRSNPKAWIHQLEEFGSWIDQYPLIMMKACERALCREKSHRRLVASLAILTAAEVWPASITEHQLVDTAIDCVAEALNELGPASRFACSMLTYGIFPPKLIGPTQRAFECDDPELKILAACALAKRPGAVSSDVVQVLRSAAAKGGGCSTQLRIGASTALAAWALIDRPFLTRSPIALRVRMT